jgi:hypothetical protein
VKSPTDLMLYEKILLELVGAREGLLRRVRRLRGRARERNDHSRCQCDDGLTFASTRSGIAFWCETKITCPKFEWPPGLQMASRPGITRPIRCSIQGIALSGSIQGHGSVPAPSCSSRSAMPRSVLAGSITWMGLRRRGARTSCFGNQRDLRGLKMQRGRNCPRSRASGMATFLLRIEARVQMPIRTI